MGHEARHSGLRDKIGRSYNERHVRCTCQHFHQGIPAKHASIRNILSSNDALIDAYSPSCSRIGQSMRPLQAIDISPLFNDCSRSILFTRETKPPLRNLRQRSKHSPAQISQWLLESWTHPKRHLPRILRRLLLDQKRPSLVDRKSSTKLQKSKALRNNLLRPIQNTYPYGTRIPCISLLGFMIDIGIVYQPSAIDIRLLSHSRITSMARTPIPCLRNCFTRPLQSPS